LFDGTGEREIDIVAAQEDVFADGDAFEGEFAIGFADGDEREIGGAAADVDDEDEGAGVDAFAPVGMAFEPGVESGLGFFEENEIGKAGAAGGVFGEGAGGGVEGGGDGDEDLGVFDVAEGLAEVGEVGGGGFEGGDFRDAFGGG
jgi:hypothetical protein